MASPKSPTQNSEDPKIMSDLILPGGLKKWLRLLLPKSLNHRLSAFLGLLRRCQFNKKVVKHIYLGEQLTLQIADSMAEAWYDKDWVDGMTEIEELKIRKLKPGGKIFDVGAHQGVVALLMARIVGAKGVVVAIEADPWNAQAAEINRRLNEANNMHVVNAAVAESDCKPEHRSLEGMDRVLDWGQRKVAFRCLDSLAVEFGMPNIVYVDVDGFETVVLKGAQTLLSKEIDWFVEVHVGCGLEAEGSSWEEVIKFFPPHRYECLIASEAHPTFVPFTERSSLVGARFFFLAFCRQGEAMLS